MTKIRQKLIRILGGVPRDEYERLKNKHEITEEALNHAVKRTHGSWYTLEYHRRIPYSECACRTEDDIREQVRDEFITNLKRHLEFRNAIKIRECVDVEAAVKRYQAEIHIERWI